jgi:TonB family protein
MRARFSLPLLLLFVIRSGAAADRVSAKDGRIIFEDSSGQTAALTQTGFDSDPWLSHDGGTVVFLRRSAEDTFRTSVYEIDMRTRTPKLLYAGPAKYQGRESSSFGRPELSASHDKLFLISNEYATSGALIFIQLASGQAVLISDEVVGYDVIVCPQKYRGDLVALKRHEEDILGRPYFLYYLYSAAGEQLGLAGDGELDTDLEFLRGGSCEEPEPPPPPVPAHAANSLLEDAIRVDGGVMEQRLVAKVDPIYPYQAQLAHIQGDVRLQVRVAGDGNVQDANLISGPPQLVRAAIAAVKQWKYQPTMLSGHPVPVVTTVNVHFQMPSADR